MENQSKVDLNKYIVSVSGKDFITFPGLLAIAHEKGLTSIHTEFINNNMDNPVVRAIVSFGDKSYTGYGDASSVNVAKKVVGALLRMAETRAIARALRFGCNIDMTAVEEIGVDDSDHVQKPVELARTSFKKPIVNHTILKEENPQFVTTNTVDAVGTVKIAESNGNITVELSKPIEGINSVTIAPETTAKRTFGKRPTTKEPPFPG